MCKKGAWIFQRIHPKVERSGSPSGSLKDGERNDNNDSRHITSVLLWKMAGSLKALRIWSSPTKGSKWAWKEVNLTILLWWMRKLGQMKRVRMKEKPMLRLPFLHGKSPTSPTTSCRSKLHDWIKIDSRCFDDNKDDDKKPKRMISRLSQEQFKNQEKFDFSFKFQETRIIKIKIQDSRFKNQEKTQSR